jgi:hypothetical protein
MTKASLWSRGSRLPPSLLPPSLLPPWSLLPLPPKRPAASDNRSRWSEISFFQALQGQVGVFAVVDIAYE